MPLRRLIFCLSLALIFALGMLMVFDTSSADVLDRGRAASTHAAVARHLLYALVGLAIAVVIRAVGVDTVMRRAPWGMVAVFVLLLLVLIPGVGQAHHGARRWLGIGSVAFQPSELAKLILPLFALWLIKAKTLQQRALFCGAGLCVVSVLAVLVEPDKGTAALLGLSLVAVLFLARVPVKYWLLPMIALALLGVAAAWRSPYVARRLSAYLNPEADLLGTGHQPYQARIAAGSGGAFGKGVGQSLQKLSYLPEAQNDYIAAIYAEEFGFVGVAVLITLYLLMTAAGLAIAMHAPSRTGMQVATILTFLIAIQAFFNLSVVSGIIPSTGLNLPLFSQGGTSLVTNIAAAALILGTHQCRNDASLSQPEAPAVT